MIKRDDILACDASYIHHVQAEAWMGAIRSLAHFKAHFTNEPESVIHCMEQLLREMHRAKRKESIRAVIRSRKEAQP